MARRRRQRGGEYWIQEAIRNPGALREWAERNADKIRRLTGEEPFDRQGRLKVTVLRKLKALHKRGEVRLSDTTLRRINLALTLRRLGKK
ncbi:MAG: hypothetical protein QW512_06170 [Thermofilaceae archaeon]